MEKNKGGRPRIADENKRITTTFTLSPELWEIVKMLPNRSQLIEKALWNEVQRINKEFGKPRHLGVSLRMLHKAEIAVSGKSPKAYDNRMIRRKRKQREVTIG